jgi:hypothetical protein
MSVADLIRRWEAAFGPLAPQDLVARYQRLRAVCRTLNNAMVAGLSKDALHEGGRKLGLRRDDTFVFANESDTAVLMDYCLYHVRRNGRTMVEQYYRDNPPAPGTDESTCLQAMQNTIYSLFRVDDVEPGVGLAVTDLATDEEFLLVDIGLSQSAPPGVVFLSRLLLFEGFAATGGAAIALGQLPPAEIASFSASWKRVSASRDTEYDPGPLICAVLHRGASEHMRYWDPPGSPVRDPQMLRASHKRRATLIKQARSADPTRRCPCGSGKMFKNCCQKRCGGTLSAHAEPGD